MTQPYLEPIWNLEWGILQNLVSDFPLMLPTPRKASRKEFNCWKRDENLTPGVTSLLDSE